MKLLTGPAGSGKTARVLSEFRQALARDPTASRLLVPTATLSGHLRNELARDGVVLRSRVVETLAKFAQELAPDIDTVAKPHFHLMVEDAILRLRRPEFQKIEALAGFHSRIAHTLSDLDAAGCTPRQLSKVRRDLAPFRDAIVAVWEDVETRMRRRNCVTRGEQLRTIAKRLSSLILPARIWIDGFAQLSGPEIDLVCALGACTDLTLTLPDEGVPVELKQVLIQRGFKEERLSGRRDPQEEVTVPETAEREVEEIARRIIELGRAGTAFHEMGVVLRQPRKYEPLLRAAFERFGVPANFYFQEPLANHPAGRLLGGTVDAILSGWEHAQTVQLLRQAPIVGVSNALDQLEIAVCATLPGQGIQRLPVRKIEDRGLERLLQRFNRLSPWVHSLHAPADWAEQLTTLSSLFWRGYLPDGISRETLLQFRSQAAGLSAFAEAMKLAAAWWTDARPIRLADFWRVAKSVVRLSSVSAPNRSRNIVHVIDAYEARQWDLATVFVCGLIEKEFPAQNGRDPFLSDAALRDLAQQGIRVRTSADKDEEEFGLFEAVRVRARDYVLLSYPRTDSRGQANLRSIFLKDRDPAKAPPPVRPAIAPPVAQWQQASQVRSEDLLQALVSRHKTVSVSGLENLLQCPFQFFAGRTLFISEMPKRPEDRLSFLLQGNIAHEVLKEWIPEKPPIQPLFTSIFNRVCAREHVLPGFRRERLRRELLMAVERFALDSTIPAPPDSLLEKEFNFEIDSELSVKGKLDRIDLLEDGRAMIVDYKFSRAANVKTKVDDETKLQGPLYSIALQKAFGLEPVATMYVSLKDKAGLDYSGWGDVPGLNLQPLTSQWMQDALTRVSSAMAEFRSGVIQPRPAKQDPCRYCTFHDACRIEQPLAIPASGN